jgi:uncharacterized protein YcgL (UPF0745 family)
MVRRRLSARGSLLRCLEGRPVHLRQRVAIHTQTGVVTVATLDQRCPETPCAILCRHPYPQGESPLQCFVYKSLRRADTYVYLREAEGFGVLPPPIAEQLGTLGFVIEIELSSQRKLARENVDMVMLNLDTQGYHLQWPARESADTAD